MRLEEYQPAFLEQGYHTIDDVTQLTWEDLEEFGIVKLGHQKKIMLAIKRIKDIRAGKRFDINRSYTQQVCGYGKIICHFCLLTICSPHLELSMHTCVLYFFFSYLEYYKSGKFKYSISETLQFKILSQQTSKMNCLTLSILPLFISLSMKRNVQVSVDNFSLSYEKSNHLNNLGLKIFTSCGVCYLILKILIYLHFESRSSLLYKYHIIIKYGTLIIHSIDEGIVFVCTCTLH